MLDKYILEQIEEIKKIELEIEIIKTENTIIRNEINSLIESTRCLRKSYPRTSCRY